MKSLGTRLAVVVSSVLLVLLLLVGFWLEKQLTETIEQEGIEQAEVHAETILGSLRTLMLNGNGTLARQWLDRLHGVAGIKDIEVYRSDGNPAFMDLNTVEAVNEFLGKTVFRRESARPRDANDPLKSDMFERALAGQTMHDLSQKDQVTIAMPIHAQVECLACHGYDTTGMRGVLKLSLSTEKTSERVAAMKSFLWGGAIVVAVILGFLMWGALRLSVLRPITGLRDAIAKVSRGDRAALLPADRKDELGEVARVFNSMQGALQASEARNRAVMDNVVDGVLTLRSDGTIESINPACERIFGYKLGELVGQNVSVLTPAPSRDADEAILGARSIALQRPLLGIAREISGRRKNGTSFPMDVAVSEMHVSDQHYYICVVRDITSRKAQTAALRYQALHDALTDLPNRTLLMDRLQQALRVAQRDGAPLALILMDLDRFKEVNDTLGHHVGDKLLQQVGERLRELLRESDTVARLGGDEFSVLLPAADANQAILTARRIITAVEKPLVVGGQPLGIGASLGIALFPQHGDNPVALMQHADVAMYVAKRGRRGYTVYDPDTDQHSLRHLAITSELREAIEKDELLVYYQPKIDLRNRCLSGVEALVRWPHPKHGLLCPDEFIPLAEQTGLIKPLTLWVLKRSLAECAEKFPKNHDMRVSVNLSMRNLTDAQFPDEIAEVLGGFSIAAGGLKLEITETGLMEDPTKAIKAMDRLNAMGLHLSIDDFGTGYSSLAYLKQLPVNELKIDKSFGLSLANDGNSALIVRSTIDLAHKLGLNVVTEGVETAEAYRLLEDLGCDAVQGYYVGRPMPASDIATWVQKSAWQEIPTPA